MANSVETRIKAWLTPSLITVFGVVFWSLIGEIRADVKQLLNSDAQTKVRVEIIENRIERLESRVFSKAMLISGFEKLFAIKPKEIDLPKPKERI